LGLYLDTCNVILKLKKRAEPAGSARWRDSARRGVSNPSVGRHRCGRRSHPTVWLGCRAVSPLVVVMSAPPLPVRRFPPLGCFPPPPPPPPPPPRLARLVLLLLLVLCVSSCSSSLLLLLLPLVLLLPVILLTLILSSSSWSCSCSSCPRFLHLLLLVLSSSCSCSSSCPLPARPPSLVLLLFLLVTPRFPLPMSLSLSFTPLCRRHFPPFVVVVSPVLAVLVVRPRRSCRSLVSPLAVVLWPAKTNHDKRRGSCFVTYHKGFPSHGSPSSSSLPESSIQRG
jgi:hypothetical protein